MRSAGVLVALVLALGGGYVVFQRSATNRVSGAAPLEQIDTVAIRQTLIVIGQAERQYLIAHGTYGTLDQLRADDLLSGTATAHGYSLTATVSGAEGFTVTATPSDPARSDWPTLEITDRQTVTQR